jgi:hypothetical protein
VVTMCRILLITNWLRVVEPQMVPSEWLSLDLGAGESGG